jgi:hypothetical protein
VIPDHAEKCGKLRRVSVLSLDGVLLHGVLRPRRPGVLPDGLPLRTGLVAGRGCPRTGFASGGSSPHLLCLRRLLAGGAGLQDGSGLATACFGKDSVRGAACHPVDLPPGYHTASRGPPRQCRFGEDFSGPLTRRDRATPGRRDGRQHSGGDVGSRPPCDVARVRNVTLSVTIRTLTTRSVGG